MSAQSAPGPFSASGTVELLAVGDLILDEPEPDRFFGQVRQVLSAADVVIGHVEVPHTRSSVAMSTDVPAPPADPDHLAALPSAGFDVITLAGNPVFDAGADGVLDTLGQCHRLGLATAGAGANLDAARSPAQVRAGGLRFAVLSYNCVGPRESWATSRKAGCAYVRVLTHYELDHANPGGRPEVFTFADPSSVAAMAQDVAAAHQEADVVVVALHKGLVHEPATLAMYERPLAHTAIDAGADVVISHHAHILRGIEVYRGRPIFHGLGNFVTVTRALATTGQDDADRERWARRRQDLFGFSPDPAMPTYPFHPESRNTVLASCTFGAGGEVSSAGFIPCRIDASGAPRVLADDEEGRAVAGYVADISARAGLTTRYRWSRDRVLVDLAVGGT